ncbi:MAG: hypothetical protein HY265_04430 [Deltaproteobacteria bacterium]|nr:hypothetical protein [Deltaproteobacteria bacterium]
MALENFVTALNQKARPPVEIAERGIPYDTLKTLYLAAFNHTGWIIGLMARPEVTQVEDRLNQVWIQAMEGKASVEDFKETLTKWEGVISGEIKEVKA